MPPVIVVAATCSERLLSAFGEHLAASGRVSRLGGANELPMEHVGSRDTSPQQAVVPSAEGGVSGAAGGRPAPARDASGGHRRSLATILASSGGRQGRKVENAKSRQWRAKQRHWRTVGVL